MLDNSQNILLYNLNRNVETNATSRKKTEEAVPPKRNPFLPKKNPPPEISQETEVEKGESENSETIMEDGNIPTEDVGPDENESVEESSKENVEEPTKKIIDAPVNLDKALEEIGTHPDLYKASTLIEETIPKDRIPENLAYKIIEDYAKANKSCGFRLALVGVAKLIQRCA
jgi:hypothetical protein